MDATFSDSILTLSSTNVMPNHSSLFPCIVGNFRFIIIRHILFILQLDVADTFGTYMVATVSVGFVSISMAIYFKSKHHRTRAIKYSEEDCPFQIFFVPF